VSVQLHSSAALPPGGWMDSRAGLNVVENRKIRVPARNRTFDVHPVDSRLIEWADAIKIVAVCIYLYSSIGGSFPGGKAASIKCRCLRMRGTIPPLVYTFSWRSAWLSTGTNLPLLCLTLHMFLFDGNVCSVPDWVYKKQPALKLSHSLHWIYSHVSNNKIGLYEMSNIRCT
jgi:hypothetical protein